MLPETASPSSFDLWERCTSWPTGWPPPSAARALERLASAEEDPPEFGIYRQRVVDDGDRTWLGTLPLIADLQRMVLDNWRNAGLIEVDITEVNEWINQQGANLSDEEQAAFQQLLSVFIVMALDFNTAAQGVSRDPDQRGVFYAASQPSKV